MTNEEIFGFLKGRPVELLGAGVSNMPLARILRASGANVTVRDRCDEEKLGERADELRRLGCGLVLGEDYLRGIGPSLIFRSPGIRPDTPGLPEAVQNGAVLTSEIEMFLEKTPARVFGITGSDGKSTTTTVVSLLLREMTEKDGSGRNVFLGGNIGDPLLPRLDQMKTGDFAVAELSSFQLMTASDPVEVAVITNITPNHLNWHRDMDEYVNAKAKILRGARIAVLNAGCPITRELGETCDCPVRYFTAGKAESPALRPQDAFYSLSDGWIVRTGGDGKTEKILHTRDILLPGLHNVENYMAAYAAVEDEVDKESLFRVASTFPGVPHRLQLVGHAFGTDYYNSSIDTTPTRTLAALGAMRQRKLVLILGGYDKKIPFEPLAEGISGMDNIRALVLTGDTGPKIRDCFAASESMARAGIPMTLTGHLAEAMEEATRQSRAGDAVLLSPACASFDEFQNFEKRGEAFVAYVKELEEKENARH
ncbi:MAG: UDP-N-acetylmuramoyl-L-alanine--D-glutamate ligase [Clostridia bacterium]|nr:UDP-N-acetylmuramoyl-L-alanine--D-glutamate ligase [Clostridia bacterium]